MATLILTQLLNYDYHTLLHCTALYCVQLERTSSGFDYTCVCLSVQMTGVVMNAAKRLQINAYLTKIPHIK